MPCLPSLFSVFSLFFFFFSFPSCFLFLFSCLFFSHLVLCGNALYCLVMCVVLFYLVLSCLVPSCGCLVLWLFCLVVVMFFVFVFVLSRLVLWLSYLVVVLSCLVAVLLCFVLSRLVSSRLLLPRIVLSCCCLVPVSQLSCLVFACPPSNLVCLVCVVLPCFCGVVLPCGVLSLLAIRDKGSAGLRRRRSQCSVQQARLRSGVRRGEGYTAKVKGQGWC